MLNSRTDTNTIVGRNIRMARTSGGKSQKWLGEQIGVSFQMIQKYEMGRSSINVSNLDLMASALKWPVANFFEASLYSDPIILPYQDFHKYDNLITTINKLKNKDNIQIHEFFEILRRIEDLIG